MANSNKWVGLIDPPTPYATLETWERFLTEVRALPKNGLGVRQALKEAQAMLAEKRWERQRQRKARSS